MAKKKVISKTSAKKTVETTNHLEQIQDGNLKDFKKEVAKIDSVEDIEKLKEIEGRDDSRKGALEILEDRKEELAGDEQPVLDTTGTGPDEQPEYKNQKGESIKADDEVPMTESEVKSYDDGDLVRPATDEEQEAWKAKHEKSEAEYAAIQEENKKKGIIAIKEKRLLVDKLLCKMQHHGRIDISPERSFFLTKAWLGICLAELGATSPYAGESEIKSRKDIPATADHDDSHHFKAECVQFNNLNTENAVIGLRKDLLDVIEFLEGIDSYDYTREFAIARTQAYINAREARFHLGVILGSLKV